MREKDVLKKLGFHVTDSKNLIVWVLSRHIYSVHYLEATGKKGEQSKVRRSLFLRWYLGEPLSVLMKEYESKIPNIEEEIRCELYNAVIGIADARKLKFEFEFNFKSCIQLFSSVDKLMNPERAELYDRLLLKSLEQVVLIEKEPWLFK